MDKKDGKFIYFIGMGGCGMSGIARIAANQGNLVAGSDMRDGKYLQQLRECGIRVFIGHDAKNLHDVELGQTPDLVVVSTAIMDFNVEFIEAKKLGIPIWHRAEMLAFLGKDIKTLAVTGTHGKTTVSSMLAYTLTKMGEDPTFLVGGNILGFATNAASGKGDYYVVEADESDKSFNKLNPYSAIITNIELDHLDHYANLDDIYSEFEKYICLVSDQGKLVCCVEDAELMGLARENRGEVLSYGFADDADYQVKDFKFKLFGCKIKLEMPDKKEIEFKVNHCMGVHNVLNVASVMALIHALGLDVDKACRAINDFAGTERRFDYVGDVNGITVIDDYAHHPTEIAATIAAAKNMSFKRVHVCFQPHRYSRAPLFTEVLHDEFGDAFKQADIVTFMDVYSAGEMPLPGVTGQLFLDVVRERGHKETCYVPRRYYVPHYLAEVSRPGDIVITMGAGDVTVIGPLLIEELNRKYG
ncbi:MAG: UDP-N-acetylmuramate--L-alanine ligase [Eggerthellaceae bacterium]|nr:UDP-N-acetylmuramate--L-alanine ligase [Eggerthellaceae bacterium]